MAKIIVTGATSFIGFYLIEELLNHGQDVWAIVRKDSKNMERLSKFENLHIVKCDLRNIKNLSNLLLGRFEVFYHLAWEGARTPYRDDKIIQQENYDAAMQAYIVAREKQCKKFIGIGSQAEYGKTEGFVSEGYPECPTTEYGKHKLKAYRKIESMGMVDQISVIWPRVFSAYGKYDYPGTLIMSALEKLKQNKAMDFTECVQNWNYLYAEDIGRMLYLIGIETCETGVYNFASRDNRSLKKYVEELKQISNSKSELRFGVIPYGSEGMVSFQPVIEKFERNFSEFQFISFKNGIKKMSEL